MITNCNPNQIKLLKSLLSLHNTYQNKNREGEEEGKRLILKGLQSIFKNIKIEDYMNDNNFWITVNKILPYSNLPYVPNYGNGLVLFLDILGFADLVNQLSKYESKSKLINILHNNIRKFFY